MTTWQQISRILDSEIKRNTEARIASQDMDLSSVLKQKSESEKDINKETNNGKKSQH